MSKKQPLVYIVIVNYNGLNDTIECIESLKKINYKNYKIIIVDNDSNDNSYCILKEKYADFIEIIELNDNIGFAGGNNIGINIAIKDEAKYVLLLNNDTIVKENFLCELVEVAEEDDKVGAVGGKIYYFDYKDIIWYAGAKINKFTGKTNHIGVNKYDNGQFDKKKQTDYITGCLMLVPVSVVKNVGLMDESYFLYYEETDWCAKIRKAGYKLVYQPTSVIYHKVSKSTKKINDVMGYYYDRNSYYFIMNNYKIQNRIVMFLYKRIYMIMKYMKYFIKGNRKKCNVIIKTYQSIKHKEMGKYDG